MAAAPQPKDPRREQLRQQALQRRQGVLDRIAATRSLVVGGVVAVSCILAGYLDASAHTTTTSSSAASANSSGYGGSGNGYYDNNGGGQFGGGTPPSASSGAGSAVSGGS